jgi:hypothetical protein
VEQSLAPRAGSRWSGAEGFEYPADGVLRELWVAEARTGVDAVVVGSAAALLVDVAGGGKVCDDSLGLSRGDPDGGGNGAGGAVGSAGYLEENMGVAGQEEPGTTFF